MRRYGPEGALLIVDLDGFKLINDSLGHKEGDEFAILTPTGAVAEAQAVAQAVVDVVREVGAGSLPNGIGITGSAGVALMDADTLSAEEVLVYADQAMYKAKAAGRDRYGVHGVGR